MMRCQRVLATAIVPLLFLVSSCRVFAAENIRVVIADNKKSISLRAPGGMSFDGVRRQDAPKQRTVYAASVSRPVRISARKGFLSVNGHSYRGLVELRRKKNGLLQAINELDIEEYLKGVIAAEIPSDWDTEALKAQAVASRTYALYQKRNVGRRPFHMLATVDSQVYLGRRGERPSTTAAVEATKGMVVVYEGELIPAFYHSSCGGHTEDARELWGIDEPYLRGVDCDCQDISKYGLWEKRFPVAKFVRALEHEGYRLGDMMSMETGSLTAAGRVKDVVVRQGSGTMRIPADIIRQALGYENIPSTFFEPELDSGEVVFSGRGMGHGVGLCQWGALVLARKGFAFTKILEYYYPGTSVTTLPPGR